MMDIEWSSGRERGGGGGGVVSELEESDSS